MHTLDQLETLVRAWAAERGIYEHSTPQAQTLKAVSEMGELADNILKGRHEAARDDLGDLLVCAVNVAALIGTDLRECLSVAYEEIRHRKGRMSPSGAFIKEGDEE